MARVSSILSIAILVIVLVSVGNAQQVPVADSVAEAAREQKALNSKQMKPAQKKIYTNSDVVTSDATAPKTDTQTTPQTSSSGTHAGARASSPNADQPAVVKSQKSRNSGDERSPIFDRAKQDSPETIVVPTGTKIIVDISEENPPRNVSRVHSAKVVNIVQVGSTVVIPALSKVAIQESVGVMELTEVTIGGVRYELQTDRVPLMEGSISEATFTLTRDLTIKR